MSSIAKSKEELEELYSKLNEQYNSLLEKNQNDLIKIKQKQKTFNETIQALKQQKQQNEKKYKNDINVLMLELQKMKNGVSSSTLPKKQEAISTQTKNQKEEIIDNLKNQLVSHKKQINAMKDIVDLNKERIEHLEQNARKLIDQNITLTSQFQDGKKQLASLKTTINNISIDNEHLKQKIKDLEDAQKMKNVKTQIYGCQTDGDYIVSYKEHNALIQKFNNQIKELNKEIQSKEEQNELIKNRLKETNDQLKRYMDRDRKNNILLKKKSEELENLQVQIENARKSHKTQRKRLTTQDSCTKCKQWQQQNKLLKQMVKSMQTMVRVRQMEAERYKNREVLNNSKIHDKSEVVTQPKKSRGQLPPLNKKG